MRIGKVFDYLLITSIVLISFVPLISRTISPYLLIAIAIIICIRTLYTRIDVYLFFSIILWLAYLVIEYVRVSYITSIGNLLTNLLFVIFAFLLFKKNEESTVSFSYLIKLIAAVQTYIAISNIVYLTYNINAVKYITGSVSYYVNAYYISNIADVTNVFNSTILSVSMLCIIGFMKSLKKRYKVSAYLILFVNVIFIIMSQSFANVCVIMLGILAFIFYNINAKKKVIYIVSILFIVIMLILFWNLLLSLIANSNVLSRQYQNRLLDVMQGFSNNFSGRTVSGRWNDSLNSLKTFIRNPIFGAGLIYSTDTLVIGMHSELLDFIGRYGLFGIMIFVLIVRRIIRRMKLISNAIGVLLIVIIIYACINPLISVSSGFLIFYFIPRLNEALKGENGL